MTAMRVGRIVALVGSSVLMAIGIGFSVAAIISPAWQVVDIKEFGAEHQHGLWQDCARTDRTHFQDNRDKPELHCTFKFDFSSNQLIDPNEHVDENTPSGESEHHQFHGWQVTILCLICGAILAGVAALFVACCTACYRGCAVVFTVLAFLTVVLSVIAMGVFYVIAHRVDNRFIEGLVNTYEQTIGHAYYYEVISFVCYLLSFLTSILTSYLFLYHRDSITSSENRAVTRDAPLLSSYRPPENETEA